VTGGPASVAPQSLSQESANVSQTLDVERFTLSPEVFAESSLDSFATRLTYSFAKVRTDTPAASVDWEPGAATAIGSGQATHSEERHMRRLILAAPRPR
jgi:hypothetical protein